MITDHTSDRGGQIITGHTGDRGGQIITDHTGGRGEQIITDDTGAWTPLQGGTGGTHSTQYFYFLTLLLWALHEIDSRRPLSPSIFGGWRSSCTGDRGEQIITDHSGDRAGQIITDHTGDRGGQIITDHSADIERKCSND